MKLSTIFSDNLEILWESAERSTKTFGVSVVFEDLDGMRITAVPDRKENENKFIQKYIICEICKETYRKRNISEARLCNISDRDASWRALAMKLQIPLLFRCHAGVSNFLIPVTIGGSVVGNVFGGQFFIQRESEVDEIWVGNMKKSVMSRWETEGWKIEDDIKDEYENCLEEFLLGPESGGYSIAGYIDWLNSSYRNTGVVREDVIPISLLPEYRKTIYGADRWELIEDLINRNFERPSLILESLKEIRTEGHIPPPNPTRAEVAKFLDILGDRVSDKMIHTRINNPSLRQSFERNYRVGIERYEKEQNRHTKSLQSILDIIGKLYSEAIALSRLGNERYYLKLFEGVSSRIPEFVQNKCKQELDWIRENTRKLVIGARKPAELKEYQEKILEMNRKFYTVLREFQEYQEKYTSMVMEKLSQLVAIRYDSSTEENLLDRFFNTYKGSLCTLGDIDEEIDRCERAYLTSILRLQRLRHKISELEGQLERQDSETEELDKEEFKVKTKKHMEPNERQDALERIQKSKSDIKTKRAEIDQTLANLYRIIEKLETQKDHFLRGIYDCKKVSEELKIELEKIYNNLNEKLKAILEGSKERPVLDSFETAIRVLKEEPEILRIHELELCNRLLLGASETMKFELGKLEGIESTDYYKLESASDRDSIGIIGVKDWTTNRLVWVNETMAKLIDLHHKRGFHVRYDTLYFNAGGLAPVHTDIEKEQEKWMIERDETGPVSQETEDRIERELKITRKFLAFVLGVNEKEVVLTDSTTEGIFLALNAITFRNGDEIVTTDSEHDVVRYLLRRTREKHEVHDIHIDVIHCEEDEIPSKITKRTRLVLFSDIFFSTGDRAGSKEIISKCRGKYAEEVTKEEKSHKSEGILFLIDGAQSVGQTVINLRDIDCDFFAMDGHKWLLASEGSGALFVREKYLEKKDKSVDFTFIKNYMVAGWVGGYHPKDEKGRSYELATINLSSKIGLKTAIQIIARDGLVDLLNQINIQGDKTEAAWKVIVDAFDRNGDLKAIDADISKTSNITKLKDVFPDLFTIHYRNNEIYLHTRDPEQTEKLLKKCVLEGVSSTRNIIGILKDHFWQRFGKLQEFLESNPQSAITVKRTTKHDNEGGVVGFQLIDRSTKQVLDWPSDDGIFEYPSHSKLGRIMEKEYKIIFRVIPPPYQPAIRICLHKYNTLTEIDLLYYALQKAIPSLAQT